jgi:creatinine amidohydrolase/Fe(II)-dependent formamide hydrolase-like protein
MYSKCTIKQINLKRDTLYEVKGPKTLYEMSWKEAEDALKKTDIAIIPVGSIEQHGLHLPLGSDSIQVDDLVRMVIDKCAEEGITVVSSPHEVSRKHNANIKHHNHGAMGDSSEPIPSRF